MILKQKEKNIKKGPAAAVTVIRLSVPSEIRKQQRKRMEH